LTRAAQTGERGLRRDSGAKSEGGIEEL
jgi:hypothetical protein